MAKDMIERTAGMRRQTEQIICQAYERGYKDGEEAERARREKEKGILKPCPFCGAAASIEIETMTDGNLGYSITCAMCEAATAKYAYADDAEGAWNRRTACQ